MNFIFQQINDKNLIKTLETNDYIYLKNVNIKLPIHKVIAYKSDFIKSMITSKLNNSREIKLEISDNNLRLVINYFYFKKLEIKIDNFSELFYVSQYLLLSDLQEAIENFLINLKLNISNFELFYNFYGEYNHILNKQLQDKFNNYFQENLKSYLLSDLVTNLDILDDQIENLNYNEILKILNNVTSLEKIDLNIDNIKSKILNNKWKYLSKNDFWDDFIPLLEKLEIKIECLPNFQNNLNFINKFDGNLKDDEDFNNYLKILDLQENSYLDVLDEKNIWYLAKITKKINEFIIISYRGWNDKFNETINLNKDISRIALAYTKSIKYNELPINSLVEYKGGEPLKWDVYKVIENNNNFIGLKQINKNILVKANPNSLFLATHPTHIRKLTYYLGSGISITDINWDMIPEDCLVDENLN